MGVECPKCHSNNPDTQRFCGECGTQLPSPEEITASPTKTLETPVQELTRGTTFADRYEFMEELGRGGMGRVYKVFDKKIQEEIALKLLRPEISGDEKTIERFSNELKFARKIVHKNIGRMYDINEEKGTHYITMEYVAGEDSKSFIRRAGQLTVSKAISIAKQVCDGLSEAHKQGVMHRDLKPSNIMIDKEGNARIMDFGIARSIKGKGLTGKGIIIGTPEYMSPEQVEAKDIDQRSDIYSLGVILYEMVTGRVPFEGDTPLSVAVKQKTETPPDPTKFNTQITEDLRNVILKCLDKDKQKRYHSARELRQELTNIEKGIPTTDRLAPKRKPITSREITVTFRLKKFLIPALIIIALVISGIVYKQFLPKKELISVSSNEPCLGVLYFENYSGDERLDYLRIAFPEMMITCLSKAKYIRILRLDEINSLLRDLDLIDEKTYSTEDWKSLAEKGGINHIIRGSYIKTGDNFRITTTLINVETGETLLSLYAQAETEKNLSSKLDDLAEEIRMKIDVPPEDAVIEQAIEDFGKTLQIKKK